MKRLRRVIIIPWMVALAIGLLAIVLSGPWWLAGLARLWIAEDPPEPADAIVVLGGGLQSRPFAAADLYHRGQAPLVLVMRNAWRRTDAMGITVDDTSAAVQVLKAMGVPEHAIHVTDKPVFSTADEAEVVAAWVRARGWRCVLVPTNPFHTRRVRWLFRRALRETGCRVLTLPVTLEAYSPGIWWKNEAGLITFQNEVIKYGYARLRVILGRPLAPRFEAGVAPNGTPVLESD
jgi:uncharacterized SAM-binding protein YcdF (DUF218 family)